MGNNRFQVSDEFFAFFEKLLPKRVNTHRFGGGRPRRSDRDCLNGILFVLRTGCQWKALDATGICPGSTAHDRFQEWVQAGIFEKLFHRTVKRYDELSGIDWSFLSLDGAMTKAPLGGEKNRPQPHGPRKKRDETQPACGRGRDSTVGVRRSRERA
jgi:transposase